jgi:hypothetical protein
MGSNYDEMVNKVLETDLNEEGEIEIYGKKKPLQLLYEIAYRTFLGGNGSFSKAMKKARVKFSYQFDEGSITDRTYLRLITHAQSLGIDTDYNSPRAVIHEHIAKHHNTSDYFVYRIFSNSNRFIASPKELYPGQELGVRKLGCPGSINKAIADLRDTELREGVNNDML